MGFDQDEQHSISPGSPHKLWRSFYRRWMNTSGPTMIFYREGKKPKILRDDQRLRRKTPP
jgi:hypothetical protein